MNRLLANFRSVDESFFDDLEETLIGADVGYETAMTITDELRDEVKLQNAKKPRDVQNVVVQKLIDLYNQAGQGESNTLAMADQGPTVVLFVGVNGVGKTTTIGKMANMFKQQGKKRCYWLPLIPSGPAPLSSSTNGQNVTVLTSLKSLKKK